MMDNSPLVRIQLGQGGIPLSKRIPIFYNALILTGVNLLLRFVSTSFQVYLSGKIGASGVGLLQLVMSVGGLSLTAGMAGIRTATMYLTAEELGKGRPENIHWVLAGCMRYSLVCSTFVALLLAGLAPWIAERWIEAHESVAAIRLFACFLPVNCLCGMMVGYFTAANRISTLAFVEVAEQMCSMVLTISLLHFWAVADLQRACEAVVLGGGFSGCFSLICLIVLKKRDGATWSEKIPLKKRLFQTAVPLALADNLKSSISTVENMMVPKRLSLCAYVVDPLASFGAIFGMVFPLMMLPAAILFGLVELLIPELARCSAAGSQTRIRYLAKKSLLLALLYGCLSSGILFLVGKDLCIRLYNNYEAGVYLRYYAALIPMLYCDIITDAMVKGLGQQTACVRYNIITTSVDVILLYILLPRYGMTGYFLSFLITHLLNFVLSIRRLWKITGKLISLKTPVLVLTAAIVSVFLCETLSNPLWECVFYILLLGSILSLVRVIGRKDIIWIKNLLKVKNKV